MAGQEGIEPPTPGFARPVLCQLSYCPPRTQSGNWVIGKSGHWSRDFLPPMTRLLDQLDYQIHASLLRLLVRSVLTAEAAVPTEFQPLGRLLLVLRRAVVAPLTVGARQRNDVSHGESCRPSFLDLRPQPSLAKDTKVEGPRTKVYSIISVTVPAPTVRPPSRMANRPPASSATGAINSPTISVLSPGITISTPSGSFSVPVTSVVRM